jgi:hypothetical protein
MAKHTTKPTTDLSFNPSYSTVEKIILLNDKQEKILDVTKPNTECKYKTNDQCQYERLELSESVTELFPSGALIVRNVKDISTFITINEITKIQLIFIDGGSSTFDITSVSYLNNAASANEENYIAIHFTNLFYRYSQTRSLNEELIKRGGENWKNPQVLRICEFVQYVNDYLLKTFLGYDAGSSINTTNNYCVYKLLNPKEYRIESPTDNLFQYLKYLSNFATSNSTLVKTTIPKNNFHLGSYNSSSSSGSNGLGSIFSESGIPPNIEAFTSNDPNQNFYPRFLFWTDLWNRINFKYFSENINDELNATDEIITKNYLRFGVFNGELTLQQLSDGKIYRKINFLRTDPNNQYVSKNYHYIRKTPKILDIDPDNVTDDYYTKNLSYQFLDEGEKYNIELFSSIRMDGNTLAVSYPGNTGATAGSDELIYKSHWGYFNELDPVNDGKSLTLLGQDFGTKKNFSDLKFMGNSGYLQYVDNPDMWKNMFDLTPVHPHDPDHTTLPAQGIVGADTNLQKILNIRYKTFLNHINNTGKTGSTDRLDLMRKIEKQNFVMYVLCCMSKQEQSFFALLTQYERDNKSLPSNEYGPYRYNWVKVNFKSPYGSTGPALTGPGSTYYIHQVEKWEKDGVWKGSATQDDTWAINLNERMMGLPATNDYFAPGWVKPTGNFKWRPVGVKNSSFSTSGQIQHLVKMNMVPYTDLLFDSHNKIDSTQLGKYLYYFIVENVVDGSC